MKQSTINLLPPAIKKHQRYNALANTVIKICFGLLGVSIVWGGGVFYSLVNLGQKNKEKLNELSSLKSSIGADEQIEKQAMLINERVMVLAEVQQYPDWQSILDEIAKFTPSTIKLSNLQLTAGEDRFVTITGGGETRRAIIEYQLAIEDSVMFSEVEITALGSAVGESKAISFSITMQKEEKPKEKP